VAPFTCRHVRLLNTSNDLECIYSHVMHQPVEITGFWSVCLRHHNVAIFSETLCNSVVFVLSYLSCSTNCKLFLHQFVRPTVYHPLIYMKEKFIYDYQISLSWSYDEVYSQSNADIYSKKQNTILLNGRQRNRHASKQDKCQRLGLYANEDSRQRELHVQANNTV